MSKNTDKEFNLCEVQCDNPKCKVCEEFDDTDFKSINADLRSRGWITKLIDGCWYDFCSKECHQFSVGKE